MNVKLARKMDYYIGIPLCWILSVFYRISGANKSAAGGGKGAAKILFIELCEMGSIILSYPSIMKLKRIYPESELYFLTFEQNKEAVLECGAVSENNILLIRSSSILLLLLDFWRGIRKLRGLGIDTVIDMNLFFRVSAILSFLTRAQNRIGFYQRSHKGLYRGGMQTHKVLYDPHKHMKENFISLVDALMKDDPWKKDGFDNYGQNGTAAQQRIDFSACDQMRARLCALSPLWDPKHKTVLVNLGTNDIIGLRAWPRENYNKLILSLLQHEDYFIIMIGKGHPGHENLIKHERCLDLIDRTSFKDIICLCRIAGALVSHDCGLVHLASLTDILICALFGPETPLLYAPISRRLKIFYKHLPCSPCLSAYNHKFSFCLQNSCLREIRPQEVYDYLSGQIDAAGQKLPAAGFAELNQITKG